MTLLIDTEDLKQRIKAARIAEETDPTSAVLKIIEKMEEEAKK